MSDHKVHVNFSGRIVFVGFGSIGQGVLPLMMRHIGTFITLQPRCVETSVESFVKIRFPDAYRAGSRRRSATIASHSALKIESETGRSEITIRKKPNARPARGRSGVI